MSDNITVRGAPGAGLDQSGAEIVALLADMEFTDRRAALRSGRDWVVYVHPWQIEATEDRFDALVSFVPQTPDAIVPRD